LITITIDYNLIKKKVTRSPSKPLKMDSNKDSKPERDPDPVDKPPPDKCTCTPDQFNLSGTCACGYYQYVFIEQCECGHGTSHICSPGCTEKGCYRYADPDGEEGNAYCELFTPKPNEEEDEECVKDDLFGGFGEEDAY
jgi:hypothetical protein